VGAPSFAFFAKGERLTDRTIVFAFHAAHARNEIFPQLHVANSLIDHRFFHHIQPVRTITDAPPAMPENGGNMIGQGKSVSVSGVVAALPRPFVRQSIAAKSLFRNILRVSLYF
jgi:hypothetical protein